MGASSGIAPIGGDTGAGLYKGSAWLCWLYRQHTTGKMHEPKMLSASVSIDFSAPAAGPLLVPSNDLRYSRPQHLHSFHWMLGLDGQPDSSNAHTCCMIANGTSAGMEKFAGCGPPLLLGVWFHILLGMCLCTDLLQAMRFIMLSPAPAAGCVRPLFIWGSHPEHDHRRRLHPIFRRLRRASLSHCPMHGCAQGHSPRIGDGPNSISASRVCFSCPPSCEGRAPQSGHWALGTGREWVGPTHGPACANELPVNLPPPVQSQHKPSTNPVHLGCVGPG